VADDHNRRPYQSDKIGATIVFEQLTESHRVMYDGISRILDKLDATHSDLREHQIREETSLEAIRDRLATLEARPDRIVERTPRMVWVIVCLSLLCNLALAAAGAGTAMGFSFAGAKVEIEASAP